MLARHHIGDKRKHEYDDCKVRDVRQTFDETIKCAPAWVFIGVVVPIVQGIGRG